ncbi:MAG TPA: hypothetical protein VKS44_01215 [Candidatus Acidoferrales bacterium]|nr:hypothetical protein [Candidatus Acidoferrales bacterium]
MIRCWKSWIPFVLLAPAIGLVGAHSLNAQTRSSAGVPTSNTMVPSYDLAKEVRVQGTIEKIDGFGTSGPIGTHIYIQTAAGTIDAHLGFGAASKPGHLGIAPGQSVTVIGMMEIVGRTNVLIARILTTPNHIFVLRNEHGVPIRGIPHGSARAKTFFSYAPSTGRESAWKTL